MAIAVTTLGAGVQQALSDGKPCLLAKNILAGQETSDVTAGIGPETGISAIWRTASGKALLLPDTLNAVGNTDLAQSPLRAFDSNLAGMTAPWQSTTAVSSPASVLFFRGDQTASFDSVVIANHNFKDLSDFVREENVTAKLFVEVYAGETNAFGAGTFQKLVRWEAGVTPGFSAFTDERLVCLDLGTSGSQVGGFPSGYLGKYFSYTNAPYFQLVVGVDDGSSGGTTTQLPSPQIGELFIGPRRQLSRNPTFDTWDVTDIESATGQFSSTTGIQTRYGISLGQSLYNPTFTPGGDADLGISDLYSLNDYATLQTFWEETNYGSNPFFLIPVPSVSPTVGAPFCSIVEADFPALIEGGLTERNVAFEFEEIPPYTREEA